MLPFKNRLFKKQDLLRVQKLGRSFAYGPLLLKILKNGLKETRIGIIVGKGFSLKAVERNRLKRALKGTVRLNLGQLKEGLDIVIIAKKNQSKEKIKKNWGRAMEKSLQISDLIK